MQQPKQFLRFKSRMALSLSLLHTLTERNHIALPKLQYTETFLLTSHHLVLTLVQSRGCVNKQLLNVTGQNFHSYRYKTFRLQRRTFAYVAIRTPYNTDILVCTLYTVC